MSELLDVRVIATPEAAEQAVTRLAELLDVDRAHGPYPSRRSPGLVRYYLTGRLRPTIRAEGGRAEVTAPKVAGVWLRVPRDHSPHATRPLAAVARADGTLAHLVDAGAAAHLATVYCHPTRAVVGLDVLVGLRDWTLGQVAGARLVVLGGYADPHGPKNPYLRAELLTALRLGLHQAGLPAAVVRPAMLGRYATGHAYGDCYQAACELFADQLAASHAQAILADAPARALWLRTMGLDHLGAPPVARTARQRAALREVAWPTPTGERAP